MVNTIKKSKKSQEDGFASVVIALTMIIVLALLVVGFSQLARREQQSALTKQLSTQAQYAAETGINDIRKLIESGEIYGLANLNTEKCVEGEQIDALKQVSANTGVSYSCAIVKTLVKDIKFSGLGVDSSQVINFQATDASGVPRALSSLRMEWTSEGASTSSFPASKTLPPQSEWKNGSNQPYPSVIQFALTPYNENSLSRSGLASSTATSYLYPASTSTGLNYNSHIGGGAGGIAQAGCSSNKCSITMTNLPAGADMYLMHLINIYVKSDMVITGKYMEGGSEHDAYFKGAQAMVDVTGKSRNVLKRLQVRIPLTPNAVATLPGYALEAQNICKRMKTMPHGTTFSVPADAGGQGGACTLTD